MAKFKLSLIVPNNDDAFDKDNQTEFYLSSVITDFNDQQSEYKNNKENIKDLQASEPEVIESDWIDYEIPEGPGYDGAFELREEGEGELNFPVDAVHYQCICHIREYDENWEYVQDYPSEAPDETVLDNNNTFTQWEFPGSNYWSCGSLGIDQSGVYWTINILDGYRFLVLVIDQIQYTKLNTIPKTPSKYKLSHTTSYTYNEKLSIHKNGQQELTFSMDDKVLIDNEWIENPFARILRTGVQLELQDKYNNRKLFTVNKIQYNFNNVSIVYNVTCQDSFTYQLNRQNSGYTLSNDENSEDFIGALNIDKWAERIAEDCYVSYEYLPLARGLYQDNNGVLCTFNPPSKETEYPVEMSSNNVFKIIKPIYNEHDYEEFYQEFPFSTSGSSANAALIAAAEQLGLQLNVVEGLAEYNSDTAAPIKYARYFFFGPTKNPDVSGLTYSPLRDIQTFGLSFTGDSLTTVLNVQSTTWNDQEIGLLPTVPPFFNALFTNAQWTQTEYYPGFFMEAVKGKQYTSEDIGNILNLSYDETANYYYTNWVVTIDNQQYWALNFKSTADIKWPYYYDLIRFYWEDKTYYTSFLPLTATSGLITPYQSNDLILLGYDNPETHNWKTYQQDQLIDMDVNISSGNWFILVKKTTNDDTLYIHDLYFTIGRNYSKDEIDFAAIAEECPWLENKLMDFSYFVRQGILSKYEYDSLMDWLLNKLRIINGRLICFAQSYYWALHERTKILAKIEQNADTIGATFYSEVVDPYTKTGMISSNISTFVETYHELFEVDHSDDENHSILNLNSTIADRFNKYFSANQRFLKHIYNFREYFNAKNIYAAGSNTKLDDVKYVLTVADDVPVEFLISFDGTINWKRLTSDSSIIYKPSTAPSEEPLKGAFTVMPLYKFNDGKYFLQKIPDQSNYKEFYTPQIAAGELRTIESTGHVYNPNNLYYLTLTQYEDYFGSPIEDRILNIGDTDYVRLSRQEIVKIFLSQKVAQDPQEEFFYVRDTELKVPFEWVRTDFNTFKYVPISGWPALSTLVNINPDFNPTKISDSVKKTAWELYKNLTPIDQLYIYDYNIVYNTKNDENNKITYTWNLLDEHGSPYSYKNGNYYHTISNADEENIEEQVSFADLYKKWYSVPYANYGQGVENLIVAAANDTTSSTRQIQYWVDETVSAKKAKYFVHYQDTNEKGWAIAGGILFSLFSSLVIPGSGGTCFVSGIVGSIIGMAHEFAHWGKKQNIDYSMSYYDADPGVTKWKDIEEIKVELRPAKSPQELGYLHYYIGDSHLVNYVTREDSEWMVHSLTEQWWNSSWWSHIDNSNKTQYKHYINYYKYIVATYSQGAYVHNIVENNESDTLLHDRLEDTFNHYYTPYFYDTNGQIKTNTRTWDRDLYWIKNRYARFCKRTDKINPQDQYIFVPVENFTGTIGTDIAERFGAIKYYPLVELKEHANFRTLFTEEELKSAITWSDVLAKMNEGTSNGWSASFTDNTYVKLHITNGDSSKDKECYVLHLEPFEKLKVSDTTATLSTHSPNLFTINWREVEGRVYHWDSDCELKNNEIILHPIDTNQFVYIPEQDDLLIKVADDLDFETKYTDWTNKNIHWYHKPDINSRTYTIAQIFDSESPVDARYYYTDNSQISRAEYYNQPTENKPEFTIKLRKYEVDDDDQVLINDVETIKAKTFEFEDLIHPCTKSFQMDGKTFYITRTVVNTYNIGTMSNGDFWYNFHNRFDFPNIVENAKIIETQLTMEWEQAYTASHYCQWFIPPYWQSSAEGARNAWQFSVWQINKDGKIILSNQFVPEVNIYKYQNETDLDFYLFNYHYGSYDMCEKEEYEIDQIDCLKNNPAILDAINHIFDGISPNAHGRFTVQKYGHDSYYYYNGGGVEHKNLLRMIDSGQKVYTRYDGLYCMQLYLLLTQYRELITPQYERYLNDKLLLWKQLYSRYPGIFLENTYSNANARSSQQLLEMSKLAFQDYTSPEKQYNITVIDAAALQGYEGQELHIGDGILLNTSDYYDAVDETYRALNQYLFISDMSYNLRTDTDISLTVNNIKYQDKLLQSIVKLIR